MNAREELEDIFHDYYSRPDDAVAHDFKEAILEWNSRHKGRKVTRKEVIKALEHPPGSPAFCLSTDVLVDIVMSIVNQDTCGEYEQKVRKVIRKQLNKLDKFFILTEVDIDNLLQDTCEKCGQKV